jgi:hypothetical protein
MNKARGVILLLLLISDTAIAQCLPVPHAKQELQALNRFWGTNIPICRLPKGTNNAFADDKNGVVMADQDWLDVMATKFGSYAATGILAHEWGHMIQGSVRGTAAELQADCLAGVFMRGSGLPWQTVEQFARSNFYAGDNHWKLYGHGTGKQRVIAARRGYYGYSGQRGNALAALCPFSAF